MATNWKVYGISTPWNYVNNDVENHFNTTGRLVKTGDNYKLQYRVDEWTELKAALKMNGIESGLATITSINEASQLFTGIVLHDTIRDFHYFYFINDTQRLGNGGVEYTLQLNYFATFGEKSLYALQRETELRSVINFNLTIDRWSKFSRFTGGDSNRWYVNNPANYQLFQSTLQRLPEDIAINYTAQSFNNVMGSTVDFAYRDSSLLTWKNNLRLNFETIASGSYLHFYGNRIKLTTPNATINEKYRWFIDSTALDKLLGSGSTSETNNRVYVNLLQQKLTAFNNSLDTDKFLLIQTTRSFFTPPDQRGVLGNKSRWIKVAQYHGIGTAGSFQNTFTIAIPIGQNCAFPYDFLQRAVGSGALPVQTKIIGVIRCKSNNFAQTVSGMKGIAILHGSEFDMTGEGNKAHEFVIGWIFTGDLYNPDSSFYSEMGWCPQYYQSIVYYPWYYVDFLNNLGNYNGESINEYMLSGLYAFNGMQKYIIQNDLEAFEFDPSRFVDVGGFTLTYHPMGNESLWLNIHPYQGQSTVAIVDPYYNHAILNWSENLTKLGQQTSKISAYFPPSNKSAEFWATQKNAWETGNEQTLFNSVTSFVNSGASILGGAAAGALVGSVVPGIGTAIGGIVGGVAAGFSQIGTIGNSIYALKERKAREQDITRQTGASVVQGTLQWIRSSFINVIRTTIDNPTMQHIHNWIAINGFNTLIAGQYHMTSPEHARPLITFTPRLRRMPLKYLPLRVHADSTQILITNIVERFKRLNMVVPNHYLSWLVNLLTNGVRLVFPSAEFQPRNDDTPTVANEAPGLREAQAAMIQKMADISAVKRNEYETINTTANPEPDSQQAEN